MMANQDQDKRIAKVRAQRENNLRARGAARDFIIAGGDLKAWISAFEVTARTQNEWDEVLDDKQRTSIRVSMALARQSIDKLRRL